MAKVPERLLRPKDERELLAEARRLADLGVSAVSILRRHREEHEQPPPMEPEDRGKAILRALDWLSMPEGKRALRPPDLTRLSAAEAEAVRAAIVAVEAGIPVATIVSAEFEVEEMFQSPGDRKAGRVAAWESLPPILDILEREPFALFSYRIRMAFMKWLERSLPTGDRQTDRDARRARSRALRHLSSARQDPDSDLDRLATSVYLTVAQLREDGKTQGDAERAVSHGDLPAHIRRSGNPPDGAFSMRGRKRMIELGLPHSGLPLASERPLDDRVVREVVSPLPALVLAKVKLLQEGSEVPASLQAAIEAAELGLGGRGYKYGFDEEDGEKSSGTVWIFEPVLEPLPLMPVSRVQSLIRRAERNLGLPIRVQRHKRPGRIKPKSPAS